MDFYLYNIIGFVLVNAFLAHRQHLRDRRTKDSRLSGSTADREKMIVEDAVNWQFKKLFLPVYLLVSGADWLQVCQNVRDGEASLILLFVGTIHIYLVQR